jgi:hypothetical protein
VSRDRELERRLRETPIPGEEEAEERSWEIVRAAYEQRTPIAPPRHTRRLVLALAAGAILLAIGLSPAGAKVGDLVSDVVGIGEENAKPALRSLPASGELLVESEQGPWIVREDGSKRLLGDYAAASWSPHGIYVAVANGRELIAVDTSGNVRWTYPAPGVVRDPRWAGGPADTRIAYRSGGDLRVIAGDGNPDSDHLIARDISPVAPAWRPIGYSKLGPPGSAGFVLTYVDSSGKVRSVNADTDQRVPTMRADRRRLQAPASGGTQDRALSPDGSQIARLDHLGARDRLIVTERGDGGSVLFSARGKLTGPTWSPDGEWLLVGWPAANQWLFIDVDRPRHVVPFGRISEQFNPGGNGPAPFPRVSGWILPER